MNLSFSQSKENLAVEKPSNSLSSNGVFGTKIHSPKKATIYSALLPGLGQAYNKKYWKIPIIYAGFGAFGYFINQNNVEYKKFKAAYGYVAGGKKGEAPNDYARNLDIEQLQEGRDYYRRNFEFSIILTSVWYLLNIVDASVDAHLFYYDVSDNLSMKLDPMFQVDPLNKSQLPQSGLRLTFKF